MKLLRFLVERGPWRLVFAVALGVASGLANILVLSAMRSRVAGTSPTGDLRVQVALFLGSVFLLVVFGYLSGMLVQELSNRAVTGLRSDLMRTLTTVPLAELERVGSARVQQMISDEVVLVGSGISTLPQLILNGTVMLATIVYLGAVDPAALVVTLVGVVIGILMVVFGTRVTKRLSAIAAGTQVELQVLLRAVMNASKELRLHEPRRLDFLTARFDPAADRTRIAVQRTYQAGLVLTMVGMLVVWLILGLVVFVAPSFGHSSPASIVIVLFLIGPFGGVLGGVQTVSQGSHANDRILALVEELSPDATPLGGAPTFASLIELVSIEHTYVDERGDRFKLGPIDLQLRKGELLFLVGGNGSGKTTLAKLIVGLYTPLSGRISVDDQAVDGGETRARYRQLFSAIFSTFYSFDWLLDATAEREAQLRAFLVELGLGDIVRIESGRIITTELSSGQQKRLALAGAMFDDRPICLFDEWAADQDPSWKLKFYEQLLPRMRDAGKTIIVVTHDDRYFDAADRVIKLESGRIVP